MEKISFQTNVPVLLALHSIEGRERESQFGGVQHLFSSDRGVFYVSETTGRIITDQCKKLGVKAGDEIEICKCECDEGRGRKVIRWQVAFPVSDAAEPEPPAPIPHKPVAVAPTAAQAAPASVAWTEHLLAQTNALTSVLAAALQHANGLGAGIRPDDVRSILLSAFINMANKSKDQSRAA